MESQEKILVIGSGDKHNLADNVVVWGQEVYIADYDIVIFNVQTLDSSVLKMLNLNNPDYLQKLRAMLTEAQHKKNLKVFCIYDKIKEISSSYSGYDKEVVTNFDWSPIKLNLEIVPPFKKISKNNLNKEYLNLIDDFNLVLSDVEQNIDLQNKNLVAKVTSVTLENDIKRPISFLATWKLLGKKGGGTFVSTLLEPNFSMVFLPPTKDSSQAINILLEEFTEDKTPEWISNYLLLGEKEIFQNITEKQNLIKETEKEINIEQKKLEQNLRFKKVLYSTGKELEKSVAGVFDILDLKLSKPEESNTEDRYFLVDKTKIYIEIRGKETNIFGEKDLNQLIGRIADKEQHPSYLLRGIFIFNGERKIDPNQRKKTFDPNIVKKAEAFGICLINTVTLFDILKGTQENTLGYEFKQKLLNSVGVFKFDLETKS